MQTEPLNESMKAVLESIGEYLKIHCRFMTLDAVAVLCKGCLKTNQDHLIIVREDLKKALGSTFYKLDPSQPAGLVKEVEHMEQLSSLLKKQARHRHYKIIEGLKAAEAPKSEKDQILESLKPMFSQIS